MVSRKEEGRATEVEYLAKGVVVTHDASNISNHFENAATDHGDSEANETL